MFRTAKAAGRTARAAVQATSRLATASGFGAARPALPSALFQLPGARGFAAGPGGGAGGGKGGKGLPPARIEHEEDEEDDGEVLTLSDALASEIAEEVAEDGVDQELEDITAEIKKTFTIKDEAGNGVVHLHATVNGAKVHVTFDVQDEADSGMDDFEGLMKEGVTGSGGAGAGNGDDDDVPSIDFGINFTVRITTSNGDLIVADCVASEQLQVNNVQHVPAGKDPEDGELYGGPVFHQLSEGLQDAFYDFFEDHKVDEDLCFFVLSYSRAKEQAEYVNWLNQILLSVEGVKK